MLTCSSGRKMQHGTRKRLSAMRGHVLSNANQLCTLGCLGAGSSFLDTESTAYESLNLLHVHCCAQGTSIQDSGSI
jgi:hypothetical protein